MLFCILITQNFVLFDRWQFFWVSMETNTSKYSTDSQYFLLRKKASIIGVKKPCLIVWKLKNMVRRLQFFLNNTFFQIWVHLCSMVILEIIVKYCVLNIDYFYQKSSFFQFQWKLIHQSIRQIPWKKNTKKSKYYRCQKTMLNSLETKKYGSSPSIFFE